MTTHAQILTLLAEDHASLVPEASFTDVTCPLKYFPREGGYGWVRKPDDTWGDASHESEDFAEMAIRESAWLAVREWCKNQNGALLIDEPGRLASIEIILLKNRAEHRIGSGSSDPDALLAALAYLREHR